MFQVAGMSRYISDNPKRSELEKLRIDDLIMLAKQKRSIKFPFKPVLIDYVLKIYSKDAK